MISGRYNFGARPISLRLKFRRVDRGALSPRPIRGGGHVRACGWSRFQFRTQTRTQTRGARFGRFAGLLSFDWYKLPGRRFDALKMKIRGKFGFSEFLPYLCSRLKTKRL